MSLTLRQAVDRTLNRLQIASGVDVQVYAEQPLREIIRHKIDALFDAAWWPEYLSTESFTLLNQVVQSDVSNRIKKFQDIRFAYLGTDCEPLPRLAHYVNPNNVSLPCIVPNADPTKVFSVLGSYSDTTLGLVYRVRPDPPVLDSDVIKMDDQLIILGTAYDYLNGLGTGTNEEDKILKMFQSRLDLLLKQIDTMHVSQNSYEYGSRSGWEEE
jgi:hypothetical protein